MAAEITIARERSSNPINAQGRALRGGAAKYESFLSNYAPKNRHFTSGDEVKSVTKALDLENKSVQELRNLRNSVVAYYSGKMEGSDRSFDVMPSMQSVTSIIDYVIVQKRGSV